MRYFKEQTLGLLFAASSFLMQSTKIIMKLFLRAVMRVLKLIL